MLVPVIKKIAIEKGAASITLADTTGVYDVNTNPGGYGTPNMPSPPHAVGITWRFWGETLPYSNWVTDDGSTINELVSVNGHKFLPANLGLTITVFNDGVHHIKYYPFLLFTGSYAFVQGSSTVSVIGFNPTTLDSKYVAALVLDGSGVVKSNVVLLKSRDQWTSTTFIIDAKWPAASVTGYQIMFATEADLKLLITSATDKCLSAKVGKVSEMKSCDTRVVDKLVNLTMWKISADVKMQCTDYTGAHELITKAYKECVYCISNDCTSCK